MRIYTDGAARGNGTKSATCGWGVCWEKDGQWHSKWGGARDVTNNVMELEAMLQGLKVVQDQKVGAAVLVSDSQYVIKGLTEWLPAWIRNNWVTSGGKPVANQDLWKALAQLASTLKRAGVALRFEWVRGHNGDPGNELADQLANKGADEAGRSASVVAAVPVLAEPVSVVPCVAPAPLADPIGVSDASLFRAEIVWTSVLAAPNSPLLTSHCLVAGVSEADALASIKSRFAPQTQGYQSAADVRFERIRLEPLEAPLILTSGAGARTETLDLLLETKP